MGGVGGVFVSHGYVLQSSYILFPYIFSSNLHSPNHVNLSLIFWSVCPCFLIQVPMFLLILYPNHLLSIPILITSSSLFSIPHQPLQCLYPNSLHTTPILQSPCLTNSFSFYNPPVLQSLYPTSSSISIVHKFFSLHTP